MTQGTHAQHTPGPWLPGTADDGFFVANGELRPSIATHISNPADARLIAAAPELLDALNMAYRYVVGEGTDEEIAQMKAAIAKASATAEGRAS